VYAWKERLEFPELKRKVQEEYKEWKPSIVLIEAKASGLPLIQELRRSGIPAQGVNQSRGTRLRSNDKISRMNGISDVFRSGLVWRPIRDWAEEVEIEVAEFPRGDEDDYADTVSQAVKRFRDGGWIVLPDDEMPEKKKLTRRRKRGYY
jgi:predicted phage terminase large subunit-like protein